MTRVALFAIFALSAVSPARAGDNNFALLLQVGTGPVGNTLSVDQSDASGALVAGDQLSLTPASQTGDANRADLTITGIGGTALLTQSNMPVAGAGNTATVDVAGFGGLGAVQQLGQGNEATLDLRSTSALEPASGSILQIGNANEATLNVIGANVSGELRQIGSGNINDVTVGGLGVADVSVTFTQIGNGLNNTGASVFTNAGTVQITQTAFGTFQN